MIEKIYNFCTCPGALPDEILECAARDLICYEDTGVSIMELPSSSERFADLVHSAEDSLRKLMNIPSNYKILFMQGGATAQYSAVPLNLLTSHRIADYVLTGQFATKAYNEAKKYGDIAVAASSAGAIPIYSTVPQTDKSSFRPDADYVHICFNNTVYGTKFHYVPDTGNIPLVADMSSCFLSEPIDITKFGVIYASLQQNIGVAGLTAVIVRGDLIGHARPDTPATMNYKNIHESESMYNTLPVWSIYITKLVLDRIISLGGLDEMKRRNEKKASVIYDYIDNQNYFTSTVDKKCRSMMNVVFTSGDGEIDRRFIREARDKGLYCLESHESIGMICASVYNSMPYDGVTKLVEFMRDFAVNNPKIQT